MNIGYAYWGFLMDEKYNKFGEKITSPDGNAFYSWSIINSLQEIGHKVYQMMPNRDKYGEDRLAGNFIGMGFSKCTSNNNPRIKAYKKMVKNLYDLVVEWKDVTKKDLFKIWDNNKIDRLDAILLEWRMEIPGRNTQNAKFECVEWQPDLFIQECIIDYCAKNAIKLIIFDLDYKLTFEQVDDLHRRCIDYFILELGHKWETKYANVNAMHIEIPFDFRYIDNFYVDEPGEFQNLVYVGNRYERDWCIDKYIPTEMYGVNIYGNWLESGRDSKKRWPSIAFHKRINTSEMRNAYGKSVCTILLAKEEYLKYGFMTARIIESVFYGTLPLFISEYGEETIKKYAGRFAEDLTVYDKSSVIDRVMYYKYNAGERKAVIGYLREHLKFMDSSLFAETLEGVIRL